jgi:toxin ParE1/3/4
MATLNWTKQALADLLAIADYIAKDSVKYAQRQLNRIRQKASLLRQHPQSGRIVTELDNPAIRELIEGNY